MRVTIRRPSERDDASFAPAAQAEIDDAIRRALYFCFARHAAKGDFLHVELSHLESIHGPRHRCTVNGAVEGLGTFRVWGESESLHETLERAVHRLEMWLVRERLAPRRMPALERARRAA
jgi:hypothetical protein